MIAGGLSNPASAGGSAAQETRPQLRGSYCDGSDPDLAQGTAGCARINGYIAAGERFDERIGGRLSPFGPLDAPGIAGNQASGLTTVGAPIGGERLLSPASPGDAAR
jgi:hypothetical protein